MKIERAGIERVTIERARIEQAGSEQAGFERMTRARAARWAGRPVALALSVAIAALALPETGLAQQTVDDRMENDTAATRLRPEYDQAGIPAGSFVLLPTLAIDAGWNDNIYARSDIKVADEILSLRPDLIARSQWSRHELIVHASGDVDRYANHATEDVATWAINTTARLDLGAQTTLSGGAMFAHQIEQRGTTGDTLFGAAPIAYGQLNADVKLEQGFDRTRVSLSGHLERYRYAPRVLDGTPIDLSYRDYDQINGTLRVAQALSPGVAAYVDLALDRNTYTYENLRAGQRDSTQYAALAGLSFGLNRLLQGEAELGYFHRTFKDSAYPPVSGLDYSVKLSWSPTQLTTVALAADKAFQRAPMLGVAGFVQQDVGIAVTHELLRSLLLRPGASYTYAQYVGSPFHDRFASASLGATCMLSRHWQIDASATHRLGRYSDALLAGRNFDQNRIMLSLTYKL